jgi:hypothetical protein
VGLPDRLLVKISSEAAESVSITPVVVREMPVRELIETMLGATGKDAARLHGLLLRGSFVSGASRLRWQGWDAELPAIEAMLATFPDPEPGRPFARALCIRALLKGGAARIEIAREAGSQRRLFSSRSFWDALMDLAAASAPRYVGYSYRDRADHYILGLGTAEAELLRSCAGTLRFSTLEAQVSRARIDAIELFVEREAPAVARALSDSR